MEEKKLKNARYIKVTAVIKLIKSTSVVYAVLDSSKRKIEDFYLRINKVVDDDTAKLKAVNHVRKEYGADFVQLLEDKKE